MLRASLRARMLGARSVEVAAVGRRREDAIVGAGSCERPRAAIRRRRIGAAPVASAPEVLALSSGAERRSRRLFVLLALTTLACFVVPAAQAFASTWEVCAEGSSQGCEFTNVAGVMTAQGNGTIVSGDTVEFAGGETFSDAQLQPISGVTYTSFRLGCAPQAPCQGQGANVPATLGYWHYYGQAKPPYTVGPVSLDGVHNVTVNYLNFDSGAGTSNPATIHKPTAIFSTGCFDPDTTCSKTSHDITVENSLFNDWYTAIQVGSTDWNWTIENNTITNTANSGIYVDRWSSLRGPAPRIATELADEHADNRQHDH